MKMKKSERRVYASSVETRAEGDGRTLIGYAATFDSRSNPLPFVETIQRGAFKKTLSENPDVRFLINHDGLPLARTTNGTLRLSEDDIGLRFEADLPDTQEARDLWTSIDRKDVDEMSFSFRTIRDKWSANRSERSLIEVSLADGDISAVTFPAYNQTSIEARALIETAKATLEKIGGAIPSKEGRSADNSPALQLAFDMARKGLAQILALEAQELEAGVDETWSIEFITDSIDALMSWRYNEDWESEELIASLVETAPVMESSSLSLRLAQARAFASQK